MTKELFEKAQFGDRFVTRGGQDALFLRLAENSEWKLADLYVKDWGLIRVNRENGKCLNGPDTENDIVGMMTSLPSDLDEAANNYGRNIRLGYPRVMDETDKYIYNAFKAGAEWMAGQFVLVGGEPTGWFRANDGSEYATGLDLKEPIKLPVDFYVRKK